MQTKNKAPDLSHYEMNPAKIWAAVGVGWLILIAYTLSMWVISGQATPTIPVIAAGDEWRVTLFRAMEISFLIAVLCVLYFGVYLPKKRTGRLSVNGLLILTMPLLWFQDPLINYVAPKGVFSSIFINLGNWSAQVPGAIPPNINLVAEPLFQGGVYTTMILLQILGIYWLMGACRRRWPSMSLGRLLLISMTGALLFDLALELPAVFLQVWAYPGAIRAWSVWPGTAHQFPIYEVPLFGFTTFVWASVLFFKNDKGQMYCERGIEKIQVSPRRKTGLRYLGLMGLFQTIFITTYFIPIWWFALQGDAWPNSLPAHLRNGICGPGSNVMCPGKGRPFMRGSDGLLIGPDGKLTGQAYDYGDGS